MANNASKGNPATKRMMNKNRADRRAKSWAAGERRKKARVAANEARHKANEAAAKALGIVNGAPGSYKPIHDYRAGLA